jgi:hypothetical protein
LIAIEPPFLMAVSYIIWRNRNAQDKTLRELVKRANVA